MAVVLRLARHGAKKKPFYRLVAADRRFSRDGRYLELLGTYNPNTDPAVVNFKLDRIDHWIGLGAKPSATVKNLIRRFRKESAEESS